MKLATFAVLSTIGMGATSAAVAVSTRPQLQTAVLTEAATPAGDRALTREAPGVAATAPPLGRFVAEGTLTLEARLGHATVAAQRAGETFVLVQVAAPQSEETAASTANVSIVLDRSGSMRGARMSNAMAAARGMIDRLRDGDSVSVVAYDGQATTLLPTTTVGPTTRASIERSLGSVRSGGSTCISCGIHLALAHLAERPGAVQRMLLLSDGQANRGAQSIAEFHTLAATARAREVAISSIGVDLEYNERVLSALAQSSNGNHHFVEDVRQLPAAFEQELTALVGTVADEAEVELALAPGVELLDVADREFIRTASGSLRVPLGAFATGATKTVLVRVRVPERDPGEQPIADVRLAYNDRVVGAPSRLEGALAARIVTPDDPLASSELDPIVEARIARNETADALASVNLSLGADDLGTAQAIIRKAKIALKTKKRRAAAEVPSPTTAAVAADLENQLRALESADHGVASALDEARNVPSGRPKRKAADTAAGRRAIRSNQAEINPFNL